MNKILVTKKIQPYNLLETLKEHCQMRDLTFNGSNKIELRKEFLAELSSENTFGLYMKNVNKFYIFKGEINLDEVLPLVDGDYYEGDTQEAFWAVDMGKAEASFLSLK